MRSGRRRTEYIGAAGLLGLAWCTALLIPEAMRNVILDDHAVLHVVSFPLISVLLAVLFRRPITNARGGLRFIGLAVTLPFVGATAWYLMATMVSWFADPPASMAGAIGSVIASIYLLPTALGMVAYAAYYVVIPMGLFSQYLMNVFGRRWPNSGEVRATT